MLHLLKLHCSTFPHIKVALSDVAPFTLHYFNVLLFYIALVAVALVVIAIVIVPLFNIVPLYYLLLDVALFQCRTIYCYTVH